MIKFFKLSAKHKKMYILYKFIIIASILSISSFVIFTSDIKLPTNASKLTASVGFVMVVFITLMAVFNRIGNLFKIRSIGFLVLFFMFYGVNLIIEPVILLTGLLCIPMLVDDIILVPIWNNLWYNNYDK